MGPSYYHLPPLHQLPCEQSQKPVEFVTTHQIGHAHFRSISDLEHATSTVDVVEVHAFFMKLRNSLEIIDLFVYSIQRHTSCSSTIYGKISR